MKKVLLAAALVLASPLHAQIANTPGAYQALQGLGKDLSREMVGGTMQLYGKMLAGQGNEGLTVTAGQYGAHERNVLDVYAPEGASGLPVMVFLHGGGFVRGDKGDVANIGRWFAHHGVVTVAMNYRFAPDNTWPSGAEDVAAALEWIRGNISALGGDPAKIIVAGNSAGSMHAADYVFHEEFQAENDGVIGAVLISTPTVDLQGREIDPQRDALYYGTDGDRAAQSVVNAVDGRKIPLLIAYAENEPDVIIDQTRRLIDAVATRDGRLPLVASAPGHNHISIVAHFGTADEALGLDMLAFISRLTQ